jgi:hypothetical protein
MSARRVLGRKGVAEGPADGRPLRPSERTSGRRAPDTSRGPGSPR